MAYDHAQGECCPLQKIGQGKMTQTQQTAIRNVDPTPETTLMDIGAIRYELRKLLGVPVDVLTPKARPDSFREQVLLEAKLV